MSPLADRPHRVNCGGQSADGWIQPHEGTWRGPPWTIVRRAGAPQPPPGRAFQPPPGLSRGLARLPSRPLRDVGRHNSLPPATGHIEDPQAPPRTRAFKASRLLSRSHPHLLKYLQAEASESHMQLQVTDVAVGGVAILMHDGGVGIEGCLPLLGDPSAQVQRLPCTERTARRTVPPAAAPPCGRT